MADKAGDMLDIVHDILLTARLDDKERFKQVGAGALCALGKTPTHSPEQGISRHTAVGIFCDGLRSLGDGREGMVVLPGAWTCVPNTLCVTPPPPPALQMVLETKSSMEAGVVGAGHSFAGSRLDAQRSLAGWASEQMGGISYLDYVRGLAQRVESDWEGVQADLEAIR